MDLKNIVPWGRTREEYINMFNLSKEELKSSILGCGDGPSSFNCESNGNVTSIDPIYFYNGEDIKKRIDETCDIICSELKMNYNNFNWEIFKTVENLKENRLSAMNNFLLDYNRGKKEGRYIPGSLPKTDFKNKQFNLVLSSHFLFLYSDQLSFDFHLNSIKEMLRVGKSAKIFPICDLNNTRSEHLDGILDWLKGSGYFWDIIKTDYEFQKGVNEYLYIFHG